MKPLVSLIMPTYNRASFIGKAVVSVLEQMHADFELIIVDDGSTDNTRDIVQSFKDNRLQYHRMDKNCGEYQTTNYAVSKTTGQYLTWIHSDDMLPKDSVKVRLETLTNNPNLDFVHGDIAKIDINDATVERLAASDWPKDKIMSQYLLLPEKREAKYIIHHLSIMMRREFFEKAGPFDTTLPFAGDIDWLMRAIIRGNFTPVHKLVYLYRTHNLSRRITDIEGGVNKNAILNTIISRYQGAKD